jgi:hypothetical protein
MFAGHVGAGLALGSGEREVNVAWFVAAAVLLDALLWVFILLGWEGVVIPPDFARTHQAQFDFPWTHGLLTSLAWSALAALAWWYSNRRAALLLAAAVFSHWVLDALVHRPELPLAGDDSPLVGLGLWDHMPVALLVESVIALAGLWLFLRGSTLPRGRAIALAVLVLATVAATIVGMTVGPAPPSAMAMATSSLATLVVLCALVAWLARGKAR